MNPTMSREQFTQAVETGIKAARPGITPLYVRRLRKIAKTADRILVREFSDGTCGCPLNQADAPGCGDTTLDAPLSGMPDWTWDFITAFDTAVEYLTDDHRAGVYLVTDNGEVSDAVMVCPSCYEPAGPCECEA